MKEVKEEKNLVSIETYNKINDMHYLFYINDLFIEKEKLMLKI